MRSFLLRRTSTAIIPTLDTTEINTARTCTRTTYWRQLEEKWNRIQASREYGALLHHDIVDSSDSGLHDHTNTCSFGSCAA
ncbi:hypothetical protein JG688_00005021 [Phytophthora aleatoria]|uniref:Uncharacterized protein n=1 Tax=Phytophthora aleatoria TaxID=2496075 RepID=A0A8J5J071_9STRA|nr:hypothetical protein JG688_00005021 [Phytophthora aleatoria]